MKSEIVTACYQLITAGINGTLQGIAVTLVVAGGLRLMGRTNAATRHAVWFGTLLLVALIIPAHLLRQHLDLTHGAAVVQESDSAPADPISVAATHAAATEHAQDAGYSGDAAVPQDRADGFGRSREKQYATLDAVSSDDQNASREARLSVLTALDAGVVDQAKANERARFLAVLIEKAKSAGERLVSPASWNLAAEIPLPLAAAIPLFWMAITAGKMFDSVPPTVPDLQIEA